MKHLFSDGLFTVCASDPKDADAVWFAISGSPHRSVGDGPWIQIPDEQMFSVLLEEVRPEQMPPGATVAPANDRCPYPLTQLVTAPAGAWAQSQKNGFLCSNEF